MKYIISYDLGTGGTKASLFDENGKSIAETFSSCDTHYHNTCFHEQNPNDWWESVVTTTKQLILESGVNTIDIKCIGVSGHSLGIVPLDSEGKLLTERVPIWSDYRADKEAKEFFEKVDSNQWYLTTGNGFPPSLYSIFKIMWFKRNCKEIYDNAEKFIGTKDYINYLMTGVIATDYSYASGSGVYNLKRRQYEDEYIAYSGIDQNKLPRIYESTDVLGHLSKNASEILGLPEKIKVVCGGVDNACMALGAGCVSEGNSYTSLGTSAWIATTTSQPIVDIEKKPYVFAHCIPGMFTSATAIFSAGNSYKWVRDNICINYIEKEKETGIDAFDYMNELASESVIGANDLFFNPTLAGGSSLDKSQNIKGGFIGLTLGHTQADLIRATLEGICMNLKIALDVLENKAKLSDNMLIVGGGSKSELWRILFADIYNKYIVQTNVGQDAGALGAAAVAAVGCGLWKDFSKVNDIHKITQKIAPKKENVIAYEKRLDTFAKIADYQCDIGDLINKI